jgi:streptomycin 6-kinase
MVHSRILRRRLEKHDSHNHNQNSSSKRRLIDRTTIRTSDRDTRNLAPHRRFKILLPLRPPPLATLRPLHPWTRKLHHPLLNTRVYDTIKEVRTVYDKIT